jgi:hypothetical protein
MKTKILIPGALLVLLCATAQAQFTYTGGNLTTSQTYDGLGVDIGLNPLTIGSASDGDYIQGDGILTVKSGTLTINASDFKVGNNSSAGTLIVGGNTAATLNINMIGQWGSGVGWWTGNVGTLIVSNNGTVNVLIAGSSEQRYAIGGGQASANGTVTLNGGAMNVTLGTGASITDGDAEFSIGGLNGTGTLNLNAGTLSDAMPLPFCLGCYYTTVTATPTLGQSTSVDLMNILNGTFAVTGIFATDPNYPDRASFHVGTNSYVNFDPSGTGSLSLTNWAATNYAALVAAGTIRIAGTVMPMSNFQYTNDNGKGVFKVGRLVLVPVPITNLVFATTHVTLGVRAYGPGVAGATYQWQTDNGSGGATFTNVSGATGTNYVLDTTGLTGNYQYQVIGNSGGNYVTSGIVALTVQSAGYPQIAQDISPNGVITIYVGQGLRFSASFTGLEPIYYHWQFSADSGTTWTNISNATNTTFTIPSAGLGDAGWYQLQASNVIGANVSGQTILEVNTGSPTYIWSAPIPFGGLNAEQILTNFPSTNKIAGALVAKNGGNPITVILTNANNQPVVFAGAGAWASLSGGAGYFTGANTNLTGNASFNTCLNDGYNDNATHAITMNGLIVGQRYQVQLFALDDRSGLNPATTNRLVNWQDPTNAIDTAQTYSMADNVYVLGTFTASSNVMTIQQNMLNSSGNFNCLVLRAVGGNPPPYFTFQLANVNGFLGTSASLSSGAAGDSTILSPTINYQWKAGPTNGPYTNLVAGAKYAITTSPTNSTLTVSNLTASDGVPVYVLVATNGGGSTTSSVALVHVQAAPVPPAPGSYGAYALSNNPIGYWQLNETNDPSTGLLQAYDFSGNGNNGTYGAGALNGFNGYYGPQPSQGYVGFGANKGALFVNGNLSDVVAIPPLKTPVTGYDCTIALWIDPLTAENTYRGIFFDRNSNTYGMEFGPSQSAGMPGLGYDWNNDGTWSYDSGLYMPVNTWQFAVVVIQSNMATLYLDYMNNGVPVLKSAVNHTTATSGLIESFATGTTWIGGDPGNGNTITAYIADVALYNTNLSSSQVLQMFGAAVGVLHGFAPAISVQPPANTGSYPGFNLQISVAYGGTLPITNQWQFNGTNLVDGIYQGALINGSTSNVLTIYGVTTNNVGVYNLVLSNSVGSTVSSNANVSLLSTVPPPATNLVGAWLTGTTNFNDVSGYTPAHTHDGGLINGGNANYNWTSDVPPGAPAGAMSLYLNNSGLVISNTSTVDTNVGQAYENTFDVGISNHFSVTFWAKGAPGGGSWNPWISKYGENGVGWQYRIGTDAGRPVWTVRDNSLGTYIDGAMGPSWSRGGDQDDMHASFVVANTDIWHFYVGTYDVTTGIRKLYVDGVYGGGESGNTQYTTAPGQHLLIGAREEPNRTPAIQNYYTGTIYGVRIYNTALSADQINSFVTPPAIPAPAFTVTPAVTTGPNGKQFVLTWSYGTLLRATNVAGPWTSTGATSPYTVIISNAPDMFFKLSNP